MYRWDPVAAAYTPAALATARRGHLRERLRRPHRDPNEVVAEHDSGGGVPYLDRPHDLIAHRVDPRHGSGRRVRDPHQASADRHRGWPRADGNRARGVRVWIDPGDGIVARVRDPDRSLADGDSGGSATHADWSADRAPLIGPLAEAGHGRVAGVDDPDGAARDHHSGWACACERRAADTHGPRVDPGQRRVSVDDPHRPGANGHSPTARPGIGDVDRLGYPVRPQIDP